MTLGRFAQILSLLAALAGCSDGPGHYAKDCHFPPARWHYPAGQPGLLVIQVRMLADGHIFYGDRPSSADDIAGFAKIASTFNPVPMLLLHVDPAAPCDAVTALRRKMNEAPMCAPGSNCAEGPLYVSSYVSSHVSAPAPVQSAPPQ
ncbi:hypothetical protein [Novosphingobium lentum]|uniref:hypothetical protein n=1 Tax=Novosphingobium lentum TaxID=145287 RepID=UPI00083259EB|nr:hypothetical protein [Novosphingobium lentum]